MRQTGWLSLVLGIAVTAVAQVEGTTPLKEGLWSIHTVMTTNPGGKSTDGTVTLCRSHAYDDSVRAQVAKHTECAIKRATLGGKINSEATCKLADSTVATRAVVTMSGDTASHTESHTTYTPALHGATDSTMIQDQKYVGACPADMQPGDRKLEDGTVMHGWKH